MSKLLPRLRRVDGLWACGFRGINTLWMAGRTPEEAYAKWAKFAPEAWRATHRFLRRMERKKVWAL